MATRPPVQCPICGREIPDETSLEAHLFDDHEKRDLVEFVLTSRPVRTDEGDAHPE